MIYIPVQVKRIFKTHLIKEKEKSINKIINYMFSD